MSRTVPSGFATSASEFEEADLADATPPSARTDGYADLRSYAAIGDGRTVALIADDGAVDWFPVPGLTTPPVFARLIDAPHGGGIELRPVADFTVVRRYVPGTNVLETTFVTTDGNVRITDALVTGVAGRLPWAELARRIEGLEGSVPMRWCVAPGTALNSASPWVKTTSQGVVIKVGGIQIGVVGFGHGPHEPAEQKLTGSFTTEPGSRHMLALSATQDEPLRMLTPEIVDQGIDRTINNWKYWSDEFSFEGPWAQAVHRSALALKLLIYSPTGAIAAAATTSVPERIGGNKNYDYRFAWVRDLAYTVHALVRFGLREETHAAVSWMLSTIRRHGTQDHVFYTLEGGHPDDVTKPEVPGWRNSLPVSVGNAAHGQLQLGVYGDLLDVVRAYVQDGNVLDDETGHLLSTIADRACDSWMQRDAGIWELEDPQHYTTSKLGCWQALECAVALSEAGQIPGDAQRWREERDRIAEWVRTNCWSTKQKAYVIYPGSEDLDASILLHAPSGFDRGERMSTTIDALIKKLGHGSLLYRYSGMDKEEGTFVACAFWLVGALACVGRLDEARARMDDLVGLANDVGLYSEMIDPKTLEFLGNLPQGLSHLALINAVITIQEIEEQS
ncbi:MAG TPA: glycoside hydrolase family 15 protein [Glaciihabitans sp.]|jgi:GH15 family glucan-1,4-alpha-glucosidase|nr:glycoside hydrolase family 15 protein [Glaciihabitans sp.]